MDTETSEFHPPDRLLLKLFGAYSRWLLKRNFGSVSVSGLTNLDQAEGRPLVIYCNHPSWWDPLVGMLLAQSKLPNRQHAVPIDARALERYGFFRRLGFFGVEQNTTTGARRFLKDTNVILSNPNAALWLTPQGRFADVRERPVEFMRGLSLLPKWNQNVVFIPLAMEYPFSTEKQPKCFMRLGKAFTCDELPENPAQLKQVFEKALEYEMDFLAKQVISGNLSGFTCLIASNGGSDFFYDIWMKLRARIQGKSYHPDHASIMRS